MCPILAQRLKYIVRVKQIAFRRGGAGPRCGRLRPGQGSQAIESLTSILLRVALE